MRSVALTPTPAWAARAAFVCALVLVAVFSLGVTSAHAEEFDPNFVLANDQLRQYDSMSEAQIQAFLDAKGGVLRSLVTTDYAGHKKKASKIIYEACRNYHLNPKVMLVLLQKEQSLITRKTLAKNTLSRAVGAGCPDSKTNRYPGFGKQVWNGARLLDAYGEGRPPLYIAIWKPGLHYTVYDKDAKSVTPKNITTYKLYVYNPSIGTHKPYTDVYERHDLSGNANYWQIWKSWFGTPTAAPANRPVYRFRHRSDGTYLMTSSQWERYKLQQDPKSWTYQGKKFTWRTGAKTNTVPVYRFVHRTKHVRYYTSDPKVVAKLKSATGAKSWKYEGVAFKVQKSKAGGKAIHKFRARSNGAWLYTSLPSEVKALRSTEGRKHYRYYGVAWYIAQ